MSADIGRRSLSVTVKESKLCNNFFHSRVSNVNTEYRTESVVHYLTVNVMSVVCSEYRCTV